MIKQFLLDNAFTISGNIRPTFLSKHPQIKTQLNETINFLNENTRESDIIRAFINDLQLPKNIVIDLYVQGNSVKEISKITKIRKDVVYETLKHHHVIKGFTKNYIDDCDDNIIKKYNTGISIYEIADSYNVSIQPVLTVLKRNNVIMRGNKKANEDDIIDLYTNQKYNLTQIANQLDVSATTIARVLAKNNIQINNHLLNVDVINSAISDYINGLDAVTIASNYNISSSIIYQELEKRGIDRRTSNYYTSTSIENFIARILNDHNIEYKKNDRTIINPKEVDFYIPSHNLAIEVNGIYWHSQHDKKYHYDKFINCKSKNIQLLQFWCHDIINKPNIVKSIIINKLKLSSTIMARKCKIGNVDTTTLKSFLNNNHIQGFAASSINRGLYHNDKLVMVMTVAKNRFGKGFEIIRVATLLNHNVIGGFSKLLKNLKNEIDDDLTTYCNYMYGSGGVYENNGFIKLTDTQPNYFYYKNGKIISRYKVQSKNFKESIGYDYSINEYNNMLNGGYNRVFDAANGKFILKFK